MNTLKIENNELKIKNNELKFENKILKSENKILKNNNLKTENKILKTENNTLKSENNNLKFENNTLKSKIQELETTKYVYVLLHGRDWDEIKIFLSKKDAINASIIHSDKIVAIFRKQTVPSAGRQSLDADGTKVGGGSPNTFAMSSGFSPTNTYYDNGKYFQL